MVSLISGRGRYDNKLILKDYARCIFRLNEIIPSPCVQEECRMDPHVEDVEKKEITDEPIKGRQIRRDIECLSSPG